MLTGFCFSFSSGGEWVSEMHTGWRAVSFYFCVFGQRELQTDWRVAWFCFSFLLCFCFPMFFLDRELWPGWRVVFNWLLFWSDASPLLEYRVWHLYWFRYEYPIVFISRKQKKNIFDISEHIRTKNIENNINILKCSHIHYTLKHYCCKLVS